MSNDKKKRTIKEEKNKSHFFLSINENTPSFFSILHEFTLKKLFEFLEAQEQEQEQEIRFGVRPERQSFGGRGDGNGVGKGRDRGGGGRGAKRRKKTRDGGWKKRGWKAAGTKIEKERERDAIRKARVVGEKEREEGKKKEKEERERGREKDGEEEAKGVKDRRRRN